MSLKLLLALTVAGSVTTTYAGTELKLARGTISTKNYSIMNSNILNNTQVVSHQEWIVQFKNHITESDKNFLRGMGFEIYSYLPEDALIIKGALSQIQKLNGANGIGIQAILPFESNMKISTMFGNLSALTAPTRQTMIVSLFDVKDAARVQSEIKALDKNILLQRTSGVSLVVNATRAQLSAIAAVNGVENIQPYVEMKPLHMIFNDEGAGTADTPPAAKGDYTDLTGYETGTKIMNMDAAWALGLTGQNQIVGMADTGLDSGDANNIHQDFTAAVHSGYAVGMYGKTWADPMGHGTHVAGSVLGRGTAAGGALKGAAYSAKMVVEGMWSPLLNNLSVPADLAGMFMKAYNDGARIHTNSWGAAANFGAYEKMASTVDKVMFENQDFLILFAAGNSGADKNKDGRIDENSIGTPGTAKNAITVGASENLLMTGGIQKKIGELRGSADEWPMPPITESRLSDNADGIAMFSSRGPTRDGRTKPDIMAPGTNIVSVHSQQPGVDPLWGLYNKDYAYSGGTSMACPLTAGAAAVTRQYLIEKAGIKTPSAALVKAALLNTAYDMYPGQYGEVGTAHGQEIITHRPNNDEGYGRVDMARMVGLSSAPNIMVDERAGVATGETKEIQFKFEKAGKLEVNLVWTDAPGSANASKALVNDLDMEVVLPDGKVLTNNDQINNHSFVTGDVTAGAVTIRVKGVNVPMGLAGKQPFAVVASIK